MIEYFRNVGPSGLATGILDPVSIFNVHGYMLLLGQHIPSAAPAPTLPRDVTAWRNLRDLFRTEAENALPMREALHAMIFGTD